MKNLFLGLLITFAFVSCTKESVEPNLGIEDVLGIYQVQYLEANGQGTKLPYDKYSAIIYFEYALVDKGGPRYTDSPLDKTKLDMHFDYFINGGAASANPALPSIVISDQSPERLQLNLDNRKIGSIVKKDGRLYVTVESIDAKGGRVIIQASN